jgi:hypothetical protein
VVKAEPGIVPLRMWNCRRAVAMLGSLERAMPAAVGIILEKASLEGARMVI